MLRSIEGFQILAEAGIPCAPVADIRTAAEITAFAEQHGWPIVLKIDDAAIPHKSDQGGVFLDMKPAGIRVRGRRSPPGR